MRESPAHSTLAAGRWLEFTLMEQLANIGSEVTRAINARAADRPQRADRAVDRALELFDLTAADSRWRGHRCREVLRAREEFCRLFFGDPPPGSEEGLLRYFLYFAVVAQRRA